MELNLLDWLVIVGYFLVALGIGLAFRKRAGQSLAEFFISGRSLPWWIAGTSMVATTFAADTPLAVTELTIKHGLAGNWLWWAYAFGGMITVFLYSKLWRRSAVLTDTEFIELRYAGKPAAMLRGFRAVYFAIPINCIVIGWVTTAMIKVLQYTVFEGVDLEANHMDWLIIFVCLAVVGFYSILSGMWGVAMTDFVQFIMAMAGSILLAYLAVKDVGGIDSMREQVTSQFAGGSEAFSFFPNFSLENPWMPFNVLLIYLFVIWWASWYPGAEPGGGGYVVQRMASCKNEKHALLASLWFQVAHYCLRPWPWLIVAFVAMVKFPELRANYLADPEFNPGIGFPKVMAEVLPAGLRGLLIVSFFAAFMSTLSTQINWGASYLVNDVYKRFMKPEASDHELSKASRYASFLVLILGGIGAYLMKDISVGDAWKFLAALGAGAGAVFMLRWFWWRINAWTEIVAMVSSVVYFAILRTQIEVQEYLLAAVAGLTILTWLAATFLTKPEDEATLISFYKKVRPSSLGWRAIAAKCPEVKSDNNIGTSLFCALLGSVIVFLTLPGVGMILFGEYIKGFAALAGAIACGVVISILLKRTTQDSEETE